MARPPRFDTDQLLDAAVRLAAASGPAGVTMAAVAKEAGAPSGSLYHRFPGRSVLLAEVWLRTVTRFQDGYHQALAPDTGTGAAPGTAAEPGTRTAADARRAARAAARHVVAWSRAHQDEARLLLHGAGNFGRDQWPEEARRRADRGNRQVFDALGVLAGELGARDPQAVERLTLALIDLPLALIRRHLRDGGGLPAHAEALAEDCAAALLETAR